MESLKRLVQMVKIRSSMFSERKAIGLMAIAIGVYLVCFIQIASAEYIPIDKISDKYALRKNGDLVQYVGAENNLTELIASNVTDFNDMSYLTSKNDLYTISGKLIASDAQSLIMISPAIHDDYPSYFAYINLEKQLVIPNVDMEKYFYGSENKRNFYISNNIVSDHISSVHGNLVLKDDGELLMITANISDKTNDSIVIDIATNTLLRDVKEVSGGEGQYFALDNKNNLWFIPAEKGTLPASSKVILVAYDIKSCNGLEKIITNNREWIAFNIEDLKAGNPVKITKATSVEKVFGSNFYMDTNKFFMYYNNGVTGKISENLRDAWQNPDGSLTGYYLDMAGSLFRIEKKGSKLLLIERASAIDSVIYYNKNIAIYNDIYGVVYGVDDGVLCGTGASKPIDSSVELPICIKGVVLKIDGVEQSFTQRFITNNGRVLFPFRECLEAMGAEVIWNEESKTAIAKIDNKSVEFPLGKSIYYVNGQKYNMDSQVVIDELTDCVYIPIRYAAEGFGYNVSWESGEHEDIINIFTLK